MPNDITGKPIQPPPSSKPPHNGACPDCKGTLAKSVVGWTCNDCGSDFSSDGQRQ